MKIRLWPFQQPLNPPYFYLALVGIAWTAFLSIGNPRLKPLGRLLTQMFYLSFRKKVENEEKRNSLIPWKNSKEPDEKSWVIGGVVTRLWDSDPGYFSFVRQEKQLPEPYLLSSRILQTNLTIVAPPGQGKTGSIFQPLVAYSRRIQGAAIFFDSKGNDFNPDYFDYNFDLNDPSSSIKINLFSGVTPAQAGERLSEALIPELSEDKQYFSNNAKDTMATLVAAHHASFNRLPELSQLQHYLTYSSQLERLIQKVMDNLKEDRQQEGLLLAAGIRRIIKLMENKNDILGSLATAISPFLTEPVSSLLVANPGSSSYTIEELLKKPGLVRLGLPVADNPRIAPMIGRLVLAQFTFAVLSPGCNTRIFKLAAVDEAHNFVTPSIAKGMAHARSNNAGYALAVQTLSQIEEKGKSLLNTIFAASGTKIVMAGVGDEDAERFSRTFGEVELPYVTHSQNSSKSSGHSSSANRHRGHELEFFPGGSGSEHRSSLGQSRTNINNRIQGEGSNEQLRLRRLFLPSEIRSLPLRHAIIESSDAFGHRWPAQVINMDRELVKELENQLDGKRSKREKEISPKEPAWVEEAVILRPTGEAESAFNSQTQEKGGSQLASDAVTCSKENKDKTEPVAVKEEPEAKAKPVEEEKGKQFENISDKAPEPEKGLLEITEKSLEGSNSKKAPEDLSFVEEESEVRKSEEKDPLEEIMFGKYEGEV
ncbi:MAG: hypothetical protein BGO39_15590 [Chloroflexi bacterium 54-19]|nr:MAG: hypothetical protein BGO39_15590 [Chloroflexi bacterium 54-19]